MNTRCFIGWQLSNVPMFIAGACWATEHFWWSFALLIVAGPLQSIGEHLWQQGKSK